MADKADKVIKALEALYDAMHKNQCYACSHEFVEVAEEFGTEIIADAIELLKKQEHKDKMFHALEEDWKKLKGMTQIVRCQDCKHWVRRECGSYGTCESENMNICGFTDADWYCADGEQK